MPQAILTHWLPCTNTRPARIRASCARGHITISEPIAGGVEAAHLAAVRALVDKFAAEDSAESGEPLAGNPWLRPFVTGTLATGDYVHVFLTRTAARTGPLFGFRSANRGEQAAWFHTVEAAERFNTACGGILGAVETSDTAAAGDVLDTPERPWMAA